MTAAEQRRAAYRCVAVLIAEELELRTGMTEALTAELQRIEAAMSAAGGVVDGLLSAEDSQAVAVAMEVSTADGGSPF